MQTSSTLLGQKCQRVPRLNSKPPQRIKCQCWRNSPQRVSNYFRDPKVAYAAS